MLIILFKSIDMYRSISITDLVSRLFLVVLQVS